jgi:hypothetical protein
LSLKQVVESRTKAAQVREKLAREGIRGRAETGGEERGAEEGMEVEGEETAAKRRKISTEVGEQGSEVRGQSLEVSGEDRHRQPRSGEEGVAGSAAMKEPQLEDSDDMTNLQSGSTDGDTYLFAVHRRKVKWVTIQAMLPWPLAVGEYFETYH